MTRNKSICNENQGQFTVRIFASALRIKFHFRSISLFQINKPDIFISKIQYFCVFSDCRVGHS